MSKSADALVRSFEGNLKGFKLGAAYVWGTATFRPDDDVFEVLGAHAEGDRVDVRLRQSSTHGEVVVSIFDPGKLKSNADEIRVSSASRILWGPAHEVVTEGERYRLVVDGKPGDWFPRKDSPALRLVAAADLAGRD